MRTLTGLQLHRASFPQLEKQVPATLEPSRKRQSPDTVGEGAGSWVAPQAHRILLGLVYCLGVGDP